MTIEQIKQQLSLSEVIKHFGLKADKYNRIHCPFHDDKIPSMQLYYKTHTVYCFSSNCRMNGKSMDVIDFVMYKENCSKHEAIEKCKAMINGVPIQGASLRELSRWEVLKRVFTYFKNAVHNSKPAQEYMKRRHLDFSKIEIGYNSGQFHYGEKKDQLFIRSCIGMGLLSEIKIISPGGEKGYRVFGKYCIVFALKNKEGHIVSLYFRSTLNDKAQRHFYLKDRQGLYPCYPKGETKKLILTESVIDAASLLQQEEIQSQYGVLALYGTNGLTDEHLQAMRELKELEEIILFLDGDDAGRAAVSKYAAALQKEFAQLAVTHVEPPEGEDVNSLLHSHEKQVLIHLLESRKPFAGQPQSEDLFVSSAGKTAVENKKEQDPVQQDPKEKPNALNSDNPYNLRYEGACAHYYVKGGIRSSLDSMKVSLQIVHQESRQDYRGKPDLYEYKQVESLIKSASEKLSIEAAILEKDMTRLTHLLEHYRNESIEQQQGKVKKASVQLPEATIKQCIGFLEKPRLLKRLNELIGIAGVVGEEQNRIFLFGIASSYKMPDTLHALIQGSSGSGKTRLLKTIYELMPVEDTIKFTRVTDSSFYNYPEDYLVNKLLGFEDIDGLKEDALYAIRELISNEILVSSTTMKTESGQIMAAEKTVRGPIASVSCTTHGEIYEDNMSRVFLIAVDESREQTRKIISYQQKCAGGVIDHGKEKQVKEFLQNCVRLLKPYEVINPYAGEIHLPEQAHKIRRLNDLYLSFVKQVTLINQYQRKKDGKGRLISTIEDLQSANEMMFESIVLKVDELDGSLRQFYESLKGYVKKQGGDESFILREVRQELSMSKTQLHRYISDLMELEYIQQTGGYANKGYRYKILYWDHMEAMRSKIKTGLQKQIENLPKENPAAFQYNGTPEGTL